MIERKSLLQQILTPSSELRYSDHILEKGERFFREIERHKLEGVIAKRIDSKYQQRRSNEWLKIKTVMRQEVVIGGYTKPRGSRNHFGALVVGLYDGKNLRYVGHTGGGFNRKSLAEVYERLEKLKVSKSPFAKQPKTNEPVQWVKPELVCDVKFSEWTNEMIMRHPIFMGLRADKEPEDCRLEVEHDTEAELRSRSARAARYTGKPRPTEKARPASVLNGKLKGDLKVKIGKSAVSLTNLNKVYWPKEGYTKQDLIRYYYEMGKTILPYYKDRPLILKRYPNGIDAEPFHQHSLDGPPEFVQTFVREKEDDRVVYGLGNNLESLIYLANLGSISLHPWASRYRHPDMPDWVIFDVDPGAASFETVCEVAMEVKTVLDELSLAGFPKTSGSKGLHVYVPIAANYTYDQVVPFANVVAAVVAGRRPDIVSIERMVRKRKRGRVYLDYLQNGYGKSVAGPYSVRARDGAKVSTPLEWAEIEGLKIKPEDFTIRTIFKRLEKKGDLFKPLLRKRQSLNRAITKLSTMI